MTHGIITLLIPISSEYYLKKSIKLKGTIRSPDLSLGKKVSTVGKGNIQSNEQTNNLLYKKGR